MSPCHPRKTNTWPQQRLLFKHRLHLFEVIPVVGVDEVRGVRSMRFQGIEQRVSSAVTSEL